MENNNDFYQRFDYSKPSRSSKGTISLIFTSFISALIGAICAVMIYSNVSPSQKSTASTVDTASTTTSTKVENPNLSQVSLTNYSDTAIYAANKVLPSMVSIAVEYNINYWGRTRDS